MYIGISDKNSDWKISSSQFSISNNMHYEGALATGNGYMSMRASLEEGLSDDAQDKKYWRIPGNTTLQKLSYGKSKYGTYIPGINGHHPLLNEEIVNLPISIHFAVYFDDEKLDMENSNICGYCRYLNFRYGELVRRLVWITRTGCELEVEFRRFISMDNLHLSAQRISVKMLKGSGNLHVISGIDGNVLTNGYSHFKELHPFVKGPYIGMYSKTDLQHEVCQISEVRCVNINNWTEQINPKSIYLEGSCRVFENETILFEKNTITTTSRDKFEATSYLDAAYSMLQQLSEQTYFSLFLSNSSVWDKKWNVADIKIYGDEDTNRTLRFSIYHLIRSNAEADSRVSICAKGYTGDAYYGRCFWDTEIYLLPFFIYTNPFAAKNLVMYRYNTLKGAKKNAQKYGYAGARYPWHSASTGAEECAVSLFADLEIHVTADIIYGMLHYCRAVNDIDFLYHFGIDMLIETARYWVERVDKNANNDYSLLGVIGPDEYTAYCDNNAYTNMVVKFNLYSAVSVLDEIKNADCSLYEETARRLKIKEYECDLFKKIADSLPVNISDDIISQCDNFKKYADIDIAQIWKDKTQLFGSYLSEEKRFRSKCLKQADALMLPLMFEDFSKKQIRHTFDYYFPITVHDSSLSYAVHSILKCKLGHAQEAKQLFEKCKKIDLNDEVSAAKEGVHIANCGGIWQAVIYGFLGFRNGLFSEAFCLNPCLPSQWDKVDFTIIWKGCLVKISVSPTQISVSNSGNHDIKLNVYDHEYSLAAKQSQVIIFEKPDIL